MIKYLDICSIWANFIIYVEHKVLLSVSVPVQYHAYTTEKGNTDCIASQRLIMTANTDKFTWNSFTFSFSIKKKNHNKAKHLDTPNFMTLTFFENTKSYIWKLLFTPVLLFTLAADLLHHRRCRITSRLSACFSYCQTIPEELTSHIFYITPQMLHLLLQSSEELERWFFYSCTNPQQTQCSAVPFRVWGMGGESS